MLHWGECRSSKCKGDAKDSKCVKMICSRTEKVRKGQHVWVVDMDEASAWKPAVFKGVVDKQLNVKGKVTVWVLLDGDANAYEYSKWMIDTSKQDATSRLELYGKLLLPSVDSVPNVLVEEPHVLMEEPIVLNVLMEAPSVGEYEKNRAQNIQSNQAQILALRLKDMGAQLCDSMAPPPQVQKQATKPNSAAPEMSILTRSRRARNTGAADSQS